MTGAKGLDRLDLRILETLQSDGRITNKELADKVNLSASACHQRLQRLIADGWVLGFTGRINIERLCAPVQCIATVSVSKHSPDTFHSLERYVAQLPEALEAYTVSGSCDFIIRFACPHMSHYVNVTDALIKHCPDVGNISTHVIMKHSKEFSGYPMKALRASDSVRDDSSG